MIGKDSLYFTLDTTQSFVVSRVTFLSPNETHTSPWWSGPLVATLILFGCAVLTLLLRLERLRSVAITDDSDCYADE